MGVVGVICFVPLRRIVVMGLCKIVRSVMMAILSDETAVRHTVP